MKYQTDDLRIRGIQEVIPPEQLHGELPISQTAATTTFRARESIHKILAAEDDRLIVIMGPCSIHNPRAAMEYAGRLRRLCSELERDLMIVMRVYFEKPRTTVGWKGLINDPDLNGTFQINKGLRLARRLLLDINELGMPAGTEFLDLISPQYIADLISWGAIGARTTESQGHRELASGLSCPVGFKNGTFGGLKIAIDAIRAASHPHHFLSLTKEGRSAIFSTSGNVDCHIILRGGREPNFYAESVRQASEEMRQSEVSPRIMIDFSHANSRKQYARQVEVGHDVAGQIAAGDRSIIGVMAESHLLPGRQDVTPGRELTFGQSVTDACIGWEESVQLLYEMAGAVRRRRNSQS